MDILIGVVVVAVLFAAYGIWKPNTWVGRFVRFGKGQLNQASHDVLDSAPLANQRLNIDEAEEQLGKMREMQKTVRGNLEGEIRNVDQLVDSKATLQDTVAKRIAQAKECSVAPEGEAEEAKVAREARLQKIKQSALSASNELKGTTAKLGAAEANLAQLRSEYEGIVDQMADLEDQLDEAEEQFEDDANKLKVSELKTDMTTARSEMIKGGDSAFARIAEGRESILDAIDQQIGSAEVERSRIAEIDLERELDKEFEQQAAEAEFEALMAEQDGATPTE